MLVRDILGQKPADVITVEAGATLADVASLLIEKGVGGVPVVAADGHALGFVAERDIVRALDEHRAESGDGLRRLTAESVMRRPAATCGADDPLHDVMARMTRQRLRHLVVEDRGRVVAVISVGDLVKHRLQQLETETGVLRDYVAAQRAFR